jgi:serine/threonine-protein kinase
MANWNPRANDLFLRAVEIEASDKRRSFLDGECAGDAPLRQQVEALLATSEKLGSFLNHPPVRVHQDVLPRRAIEQTVAPEPVSSTVLARIGESIGGVPHVLLRDTEIETGPGPIVKPSSSEMPNSADRPEKYQLLGEIARGGMGAVLRGRDVDLGRDLAVKVLLEAHTDKPDLIKRFVEEAQIGGQLQHPGVVPVYELGAFADRRPFFAMKLVKGQTLAELLLSRSSPAAELPRFLSIYESVAQTMAYAHARGVIHRDLKPSNVMVGSFGEVQVMDWGLAKVLHRGGAAADEAGKTPEPEIPVSVIQTARSGSDADASHAGSVLGTPGYMAPEQARGEVEALDERADVFGLGAILCEILTGKPAFTGRSASETLRKSGRGEVAEAFARLEGCGAETELIILARGCLAPEREDRPQSARQVGARITAYLVGVQERLRQTELARVEAAARAEAERKRRKLTLGLAASLLALLTVGGGGAAMFLQHRRDQASRLELALREVNLLREQAQADPNSDPRKWRAAVEAVKRANDLLGPLTDANSQQRVRELGDQIGKAAQAADRDAALLREVVDIRSAEADDPDGSASDASYGRAFRDAGIDVDALGSEAAARKIKGCPASVALALAAALDDWAAQRRKARPEDADAWKRLVATVRAVDPEPTRDRMRQLWLATDRKAQRQPLLQLARAADPRGWPPASLTLLAAALDAADRRDAAAAVLRRAQAEHPGDVWVNYNLARLLERLHPPRIEEAIRFYSAARAVRPETAHELAHALKDRSRHNEALVVFRNLTELRPGNGRHWACLAVLLTERGERAAAEKALQKAVTIQREAIRLRPDDAAAHLILGLALCDGAHDHPAAIAEFREVIRLERDNATAHRNLGIALRGDGKPDEAVAAFREAIRLERDNARIHAELAVALWQQGKLAEAVAAYREAIRLQPDDAPAHGNLGAVLCDGVHDYPAAEAAFHEAIRLQPDDEVAHYNLGIALRRQGKFADAMAEYRAAIRLKPEYAEAHYSLGTVLCDVVHDYPAAEAEFRAAIQLQPDDADAHTSFGLALHGQGKVDEAIAAYREAIRLKPDYANAHYNLGRALSGQGKVDEAIAAYRESIRLKPEFAEAHNNLGLVLRGQGKLAEAIAAYREAIRLKPDLVIAHDNLGNALSEQGKVDEAMAEYRAASRIKPDDASAHYNLGNALRGQGKVEEAIAAYRESIRLKPGYAEAHCNLGLLLQEQSQFREALVQLRRGHELGSKRRDWLYPSEHWVSRAERMVALESRLPAVLRGDEKARDAAEGIGFAELAYNAKQFGRSARLYAESLGADPKLSETVETRHRYAAACAAALAGAGKGDDKAPLPEPEKAGWRTQAIDWLKADLACWSKQVETGKSEAKARASRTLFRWKADTDLAGIRDPDELAKLLASEQKACRTLWAAVEALLKQAQGRTP